MDPGAADGAPVHGPGQPGRVLSGPGSRGRHPWFEARFGSPSTVCPRIPAGSPPHPGHGRMSRHSISGSAMRATSADDPSGATSNPMISPGVSEPITACVPWNKSWRDAHRRLRHRPASGATYPRPPRHARHRCARRAEQGFQAGAGRAALRVSRVQECRKTASRRTLRARVRGRGIRSPARSTPRLSLNPGRPITRLPPGRRFPFRQAPSRKRCDARWRADS